MNHLLHGAVQSPQKRPIFFRAFSATCISVLNIDIVLCLVVVLHRIINTLRWSVPDPTQWSNPIQFTKVKSLLLIEQHWPSSRYWYCRGPPQCGPIVLEKKNVHWKAVTGFKSTQSRHFIHSHHLNCFASSPKCLIDILLTCCLKTVWLNNIFDWCPKQPPIERVQEVQIIVLLLTLFMNN